MKGEIEKKNSKTILNNKKYINQKNKSQIWQIKKLKEDEIKKKKFKIN
jgi:hypothetical protein